MSEHAAPKYQWGQSVVATIDLINDGSYPNLPENALIVQAGEHGEVVNIGAHVESNTVVYLVEFGTSRVVGCFESEIAEISRAAIAAANESHPP